VIGPGLYSIIIFVFRVLCTGGLSDCNWRHAGYSERFFPQSEAKAPFGTDCATGGLDLISGRIIMVITTKKKKIVELYRGTMAHGGMGNGKVLM
jgi:hypothetical protein